MHLQEGIAALTKLCNQSQTDFHVFKLSASDTLVRLQQDSSSHDLAICSIDAEKSKTHAKVAELRKDFKMYSNDADEWARRTNHKLKIIDMQLQPSVLEWKIHDAETKRNKLAIPQFIKSDVFDLGGVNGMKLDWYPNGIYGGGIGGATIRLYGPLGTHIRYNMKIGFISTGHRIWHVQPNVAPWDEVHFPHTWIHEIRDDVCVVTLEILENFDTEDGGTFGTIVHIESG